MIQTKATAIENLTKMTDNTAQMEQLGYKSDRLKGTPCFTPRQRLTLLAASGRPLAEDAKKKLQDQINNSPGDNFPTLVDPGANHHKKSELISIHSLLMKSETLWVLGGFISRCSTCLITIDIIEMREEEGQAYRKPYGGRRGNGHHRGGYRGNDAPVSNQDAQDNEPRDADNANEGGPRFKKKFIRRDNEEGGRFNRRGGEHRGRGGDRRGGKIENRDLDRQLRDYWITTKGGERTADGT